MDCPLVRTPNSTLNGALRRDHVDNMAVKSSLHPADRESQTCAPPPFALSETGSRIMGVSEKRKDGDF